MLEQFQKMITGSSQSFTLDKPVIKECYIAYLDMLGYKAFFEENPDKIDDMLSVFTHAIEKMIGYLQAFNSALQINTDIKDIYKIKIFSDNVLMWIEYKHSYETKFLLLAFLEMIKEFQKNLIHSYGIFLRGGVIKGDFAVSDTFVFGKGLIDAVDLETKTAVFPRIIIHDSVIEDINSETPCKGSGACETCKGLRAIGGLFTDNTTKELSDRVISAYKTYDDVLVAIPPDYFISGDIDGIRESLREQANNAIIAASVAPGYLERAYSNAKSLTPKMANIFNSILCHQISEYDRYCGVIMSGCFFRDNDTFAVIDYLTPPGFLGLITSELIERATKNILQTFPELLSITGEITAFMDHIKKYDHVTEALSLHKKRVENEVKERIEKNDIFKGNIENLRANEKVLKKYLWTIQYHNRVCETNGRTDLMILHDVSFDPVNDLLCVHIRQHQEPITSEGV